jgi:hypothetical protein
MPSTLPVPAPAHRAKRHRMHTFWQGWLKWSIEAGIDLLCRPQNSRQAGFAWSRECCRRRAQRTFQRRVKLGNILDRNHAGVGALTVEIGLHYREKCSRSCMPVIRTRITGPASSPSQRIGDASRREPRFAMGARILNVGCSPGSSHGVEIAAPSSKCRLRIPVFVRSVVKWPMHQRGIRRKQPGSRIVTINVFATGLASALRDNTSRPVTRVRFSMDDCKHK